MNVEHPSYVATTYGLRGWYAVLMAWNPDCGGFYEPWNTSDWSHAERKEAQRDAKEWAEAEAIEYKA